MESKLSVIWIKMRKILENAKLIRKIRTFCRIPKCMLCKILIFVSKLPEYLRTDAIIPKSSQFQLVFQLYENELMTFLSRDCRKSKNVKLGSSSSKASASCNFSSKWVTFLVSSASSLFSNMAKTPNFAQSSLKIVLAWINIWTLQAPVQKPISLQKEWTFW